MKKNADNYTDAYGNKDKISLIKREKKLVEWIKYCLSEECKPTDETEFVRMIQLFYDGYDEKNSLINIELPNGF